MFFVFSVTCVSSSAVFYPANGEPLLDYWGVYGGYYFYIVSDQVSEVYFADQLIIWVPINYKDYFSTDDYSLVNISNSTLTLRAIDNFYNQHTVRFQAYSQLQIRTDDSPYQYYTITDMQILDTNVHIIGEKSPFYNANPDWDDNTKYICFTIILCSLLLLLVGGIFVKSRN